VFFAELADLSAEPTPFVAFLRVDRASPTSFTRRRPPMTLLLRKLLADKIELEPVGHGRERGYKFRGALTVDRLIAGDTLAKPEINNTSDGGGPKGIW